MNSNFFPSVYSFMSKAAFVFVFFVLASCNGTKNNQSILFTYVDPLQKVFKETAFFPEKVAIADVARGEHASFQFALRTRRPLTVLDVNIEMDRDNSDHLGTPTWGFVEYVRIGRRALDPATDRLNSVSGYYPDPIIQSENKNLRPNETQPIWLTIPVPKTSEPGTYKGKISLKIKKGMKTISVSENFVVHVYPPVIEKTSLWVTNWFGTDFSYMNEGRPVEEFSDKYWKYIRLTARMMANYNENVVLISPLRLAEFEIGENLKYSIDFSNFIKTVNIFEQEGVVGRIEGGHIGTRDSTWSSSFVVFAPVEVDDSVFLKKFKISNDTARIFYKQFFSRLMEVIDENGWRDVYMQHIADEPIDANVQSYIEISEYVKGLIPDVPIVEACHSRKVEKMISIWVPQLNFFATDNNFYSERGNQGDEVWFYTCLAPKGEYANRFIDQPLIKTRLLHWINFRYNSPGYLHWGFNHWKISEDPFNETTGINKESGNILPGGDAWIVYPGKDTIYSSIRLEAMRDGIVDYELLKMLKQKDKQQSLGIAKQVVFGFNVYETDIESFRSLRKKILTELSKDY